MNIISLIPVSYTHLNMAQEKRNPFEGVKAIAQKGLGSIDTDAIKDKVTGTAEVIKTKANEAKDTILDVKDDLAEKLTELDRMLKNSITEYNDAYTLMNDKGVKLFVERSRAVDSVSFVAVSYTHLKPDQKAWAVYKSTCKVSTVTVRFG